MSRFVKAPPTSRIDLGDGDWVEIRTQLTFGEREIIRQKITAGARDTSGEVVMDRLDHVAANREVLLLSIIAWGGPGFCEADGEPHDGDCRPRPITAENISALDTTGERLLVEIDRRQVTHSANLKDMPSAATSGSSSAGSDPDTSTSPSASTPSSSASDTAGPGTSS